MLLRVLGVMFLTGGMLVCIWCLARRYCYRQLVLRCTGMTDAMVSHIDRKVLVPGPDGRVKDQVTFLFGGPGEKWTEHVFRCGKFPYSEGELVPVRYDPEDTNCFVPDYAWDNSRTWCGFLIQGFVGLVMVFVAAVMLTM